MKVLKKFTILSKRFGQIPLFEVYLFSQKKSCKKSLCWISVYPIMRSEDVSIVVYKRLFRKILGVFDSDKYAIRKARYEFYNGNFECKYKCSRIYSLYYKGAYAGYIISDSFFRVAYHHSYSICYNINLSSSITNTLRIRDFKLGRVKVKYLDHDSRECDAEFYFKFLTKDDKYRYINLFKNEWNEELRKAKREMYDLKNKIVCITESLDGDYNAASESLCRIIEYEKQLDAYIKLEKLYRKKLSNLSMMSKSDNDIASLSAMDFVNIRTVFDYS